MENLQNASKAELLTAKIVAFILTITIIIINL